RRVLAQLRPPAAGFYANQLDALVFDELVEDADRVRTAANAGNDRRRKPAFSFENLRARLVTDDGVEIAHHGGIRVRSQHAAEQVMRGADVGHPVAHSLIDGIFERSRTRLYAANLSTQQPHTENVQLLAAHIFRTHVNNTFQAKEGTDGGCGYAV